MAQSIESRARAVLATAEKDIQKLLEEALRAREYEALSALSSWAAHLSQLANGTVREEAESPNVSSADTVTATSDSAIAPARDRAKPAKVTYPHFWRDGNALIKVGWSSASKSPYEHKADRRIVDAVAQAIATVAAKRKRFQVQDLEKAQRANAGPEVPNYQLYVALAWLRWAGLVVQHGRQGYSLPAPSRFLDDLKSAWDQLTER